MQPGKSLAEYTDEQWGTYLRAVYDHDVMKQFLQYVG